MANFNVNLNIQLINMETYLKEAVKFKSREMKDERWRKDVWLKAVLRTDRRPECRVALATENIPPQDCPNRTKFEDQILLLLYTCSFYSDLKCTFFIWPRV